MRPPKKLKPESTPLTIFVRNLPYDLTDKELKESVSEIGKVKHAFIAKDKSKNNESRGFGYVTFERGTLATFRAAFLLLNVG